MNITICIPVHNEEKNIAPVIDNLLDLDSFGANNLNIIVVSSGSTDSTNTIVSNISKRIPSVRLLIEHQRSGKANAINMILPILRTSNADICVFTDGDVYLKKDSLRFIINNFFNNNDVSVITGHPVVADEMKDGFWKKIAIENCAIWDGTRKKQSSTKEVWTLSGYLFAIKTKDLPEKLPVRLAAEDAFLGLSLLLSGKKMEYEPNALVYVKYPINIRDYYRQKSRTRSGWIQIYSFAPNQMSLLRRLQREVVFSRFYQGDQISLLCFILDNLIWLLDRIFNRNNLERHIWKTVDSTK